MRRSVVLVAVVLVVSEAKNVTVDMELLQHWDDNWEGRFCFNLPTPIVGFEIALHFNIGVKQIQVCHVLPLLEPIMGFEIALHFTVGVKQIQVCPLLP